MFRLVVLTLCAMFVAGVLIPDHYAGKEPVTRNESIDARPVAVTIREDARKLLSSVRLGERSQATDWIDELDEAEAVRIAMERGRVLRAAREDGARPELVSVPEAAPLPVAEAVAVADTPATAAPPVAVAEPAGGAAGVAAAVAVEVLDPAIWQVTADRVNLRAGPGTEHGILGRAGLGERMEPLSDPGKAWVEVRRENGETAWIFSEFLAKGGA